MFQHLRDEFGINLLNVWVTVLFSTLFSIWAFISFVTPKQVTNNVSKKQTKQIEQYRDEVGQMEAGSQMKIRSDLNSKLKIKPDWLDVDEVRRGQKFAQKYYAVAVANSYVSMNLILTHEKSIQTLVSTKKSHTIKDSGERYLRTLHHITNWYECDLFDENSKALRSIRTVNKYHMSVEKKMNSKSKEQIERETKTFVNEFKMDYNNLHREVKDVMESNEAGLESMDFYLSDQGPKMSQHEMLVTQWTFFGLILLYPEKYGIDPNDEGLVSFVHLWRYLGYLFGVEDEFNVCSGSMEEVKRKCFSIIEFDLKPLMKIATQNFEHMVACMTRGLNTYYYFLRVNSTIAFAFYLLDLNFTNFYKSMSFLDKLHFYLALVMAKSQTFNIFRVVINWFFRKVVEVNSNILIKNGEKSLAV